MKTELHAYCDGLCTPFNPGGAAVFGFVITDRKGHVLKMGSGVVGAGHGMSNNVAFYASCIHALRWVAAENPDTKLVIRIPNRTVANQLSGRWRVTSKIIQKLWHRAKEVEATLPWVSYERVFRPSNPHISQARALSRRAYAQFATESRQASTKRLKKGTHVVLFEPEDEERIRPMLADILSYLQAKGRPSDGLIVAKTLESMFEHKMGYRLGDVSTFERVRKVAEDILLGASESQEKATPPKMKRQKPEPGESERMFG